MELRLAFETDINVVVLGKRLILYVFLSRPRNAHVQAGIQ
jgi:hypothetical protein